MLRMVVKDVFKFADGRTVLAGSVEGHDAMIQSGHYGLYQDGKLLQQVELEGEMVPRVIGERTSDRAVSVKTNVDVRSGRPEGELVLSGLA